MKRALLHLLWVASVIVASAEPSAAWSNKEHIQFARLAAERLIADASTPDSMRKWLLSVVPPPIDMAGEREWFMHKRIGLVTRDVDGLLYWATMPDMHALMERPGTKIEGYGVGEGMLHYIDLEYFMPDEAQRSYANDLSHKPKLTDFPRDRNNWRYARSGMLPFRVEECYGKLVQSIRAGRLNDEPGRYPRDEHATKWAGYLAHYAADNTQPQHGTMDYKSASYFADKHKAPNVHAEVEYRMCDDDDDDHIDLREAFWPLFAEALEKEKDPIETCDPWQATIEVSLRSYDALPLIGQAAMAASHQAGTPEKPEGPAGPLETAAFFQFKGTLRSREMTVMQMKAEQTAWAVHRIERLWRQAWDEGQQPAPATQPS